MTEQLNAIVATTRTPKQPETAPSPSGEFSFGAAMAALEQNAAQALQAHGGAPQSASVADGGGSRAAKQNTSSSAPETIISDDRGNAKPASANLSDDHRPTKNVAPGAQQQSLPTPQPAATATLNIAAPVAVNGAPPLATQPNTARFDAAGAPKTATTKPDAATAARAAAPHAPKQAPESFARLLAQRLDQGETRFEFVLIRRNSAALRPDLTWAKTARPFSH